MKKPSYMQCLLVNTYLDMVKEEIERTNEPEKVIKKHMELLKKRLKEIKGGVQE